ncbi:MAG: hypothetical protein AAF251_06300 [Pseudomonadota bacterium]
MDHAITKLGLLAAISASALACAKANATLDADNDSHCAAVGYVFSITGEELGDRGMTKRAKTLYQWYIDRMRNASGTKMSETEKRNELLPIVKSITGEPNEYIGIADACAKKAAEDPAFERFAARIDQYL